MPDHPDLTDLVRRLKRAASTEKATAKALSRQLDELSRRLVKKFPEPRQNLIRQTIAYISSVAVDPTRENIKGLLETSAFSIAMRRKVDATFYTHNKNRDVYCDKLDDFVDAVRLVDRDILVLQNPFIILDGEASMPSVQSWSRPKSISAEYKKHLRNSRYPDKSRFSISVDAIEGIELQLFNRGCGLMTTATRIFFYGKFSNEIGELANRGAKTRYVRLQCDRGPRPTGRGTRVMIHAYPISMEEILNDFSKCTSSSEILLSIERKIFEVSVA